VETSKDVQYTIKLPMVGGGKTQRLSIHLDRLKAHQLAKAEHSSGKTWGEKDVKSGFIAEIGLRPFWTEGKGS